jgi:Kef-type K+ transport system membrane component KefB
MEQISHEFRYLLLIFALFVLPSLFGRLRVPAGVTALLLGGLSASTLGWYQQEPTLPLLAKFGVMALFLLAGLEVDLPSLARRWKPISGHVAIKLASMGLLAWGLRAGLGLNGATAWLAALVLLTPSTGFILESLERTSLGANEKEWTKTIAIAVELAALLVLFVALRSGSVSEFLWSAAAFAALIALLPFVLRAYARFIAPFAPNTEFAFLIIVALLTGTLTRALGTYYLVGAFLVGLLAQRFRKNLPSLSSERLLYALRLFAFFFMPFYFFHAGQAFGELHLTLKGLAMGLLFLGLLVPLRLALTWAQLRLVLGQNLKQHRDVAVALLPNLVFGVVISGILLETHHVAQELYVGLMIYTVAVSTLPAYLLKAPVGDAASLSLLEPPAGHGLGGWMDPNAKAGPQRRGHRPPVT